MKNKLTVEFGGECPKIIINSSIIALYLNSSFDVVESETLIFEIQRLDFQVVEIYIPIDHSIFKHVSVFVSLLEKDVEVFAINHGEKKLIDLTKSINNIKINFLCHQLEYINLSDNTSRNLLREITKPYVDKLIISDFDLSHRDRPQSDVEELFNRVGLAHDIVMRDEFLSGHNYWCYPIDNDSGKLVRTVDIRLYYANLLSKMVPKKSSTLLEVGAGSGFVTHYLAAMGFNVEGSELSDYRVKGARLLGKIKNTTTNFTVGNLKSLPYENDSFDIVYSCFVLEQCQEILEQALFECLRVARDKCIFFEPSNEFFPTLPSMIHSKLEGFPLSLGHFLLNKGLNVSIKRPRFQHVYNSGCIFIVNLKDTVSSNLTLSV